MQNSRSTPWRPVGLLIAVSCLLSLAPVPQLGVLSARADVTIDMDVDSSRTGAVDIDEENGGKDVVRMGENIEVGPNETVEGDVVAIGGTVTVLGHVLGDVVSVGGGIDLKSTATVNGDVVCVGGVVNREDGATVLGQNVSVGVVPKGFARLIPHAKFGHRDSDHEGGGVLSVWWAFLRYAGVFLVGLVLYLAFPRRMATIRETTRSRFWLSLVIGFAALIGVSVGLILLCITCIGIIVAIPGFLAFLLALVVGGAIAASIFGEVVLRRPATETKTWAATMAVGIGILFVLKLLGLLLESAGGAGEAIGKSIQVITSTAWFLLIMSGFGALVVSRVGRPAPVVPAVPVMTAEPAPPPPTV
jgi:hypothetical protein